MTNQTSQDEKVVILYCRVSTEKQFKEGCSIETQTAYNQDYAERRWPGVKTHIISEVASGKTKHRRGYRDMMMMMQCGKVRAVVVIELSRLWRSTKDAINELDEFQIHGVDLACWREGIDTSTPLGELMFSLTAVLAQFESRQISERVVRTIKRHKKEGRKGPGRRPYGWNVSDEGALSKNEREQTAIDMVMARREENDTWQEMATFLNDKKYSTVSGGRWNPGGLRLVARSVLARRAFLAEQASENNKEKMHEE